MNNKLVTAVFCFGSHICNQAARIRVKQNMPLRFTAMAKQYHLYYLWHQSTDVSSLYQRYAEVTPSFLCVFFLSLRD
jgi:hypothetical protein